MLVKAWETKVFPTIRRRFRNEAERKSGLDQIKGALQLGEWCWGGALVGARRRRWVHTQSVIDHVCDVYRLELLANCVGPLE